MFTTFKTMCRAYRYMYQTTMSGTLSGNSCNACQNENIQVYTVRPPNKTMLIQVRSLRAVVLHTRTSTFQRPLYVSIVFGFWVQGSAIVDLHIGFCPKNEFQNLYKLKTLHPNKHARRSVPARLFNVFLHGCSVWSLSIRSSHSLSSARPLFQSLSFCCMLLAILALALTVICVSRCCCVVAFFSLLFMISWLSSLCCSFPIGSCYSSLATVLVI